MKICFFIFGAGAALALFGDYGSLSGVRFAVQGENGSAILPGGRIIQPFGEQFVVGLNPLSLAVSPGGRSLTTSDFAGDLPGATVLDKDKKGNWSGRTMDMDRDPGTRSAPDPRNLYAGIAFASEKTIWLSEGSAGTVRLLDAVAGSAKKKILELNFEGISGSFAGDLVVDPAGKTVFVADRAHQRVVLFDSKSTRPLGQVSLGQMPVALALSADGARLFATVGETSAMLCDVDVANPTRPALEKCIQLENSGGPSGVLATAKEIYISHAASDSIDAVDAATRKVKGRIPLEIPGLVDYRGILPLGMAFDKASGSLLAAEAGINAVAVIDVVTNKVRGHIPVGLFPTRLTSAEGRICSVNRSGRGTGPNAGYLPVPHFGAGSVSCFSIPEGAELAKQTRITLLLNGLVPVPAQPRPMPALKHVILIEKQGRSFDEVFGDVKLAGGNVAGSPALAHFGDPGIADGRRERLSLHQVSITPNQHALARAFSISDNFYIDAQLSLSGRPWILDGSSATDLWGHLERHQVAFRKFELLGDHTDQLRAATFIKQMEGDYATTGKDFPQVVYIRLPNDRTADAHPADGFPYRESYVADNDVALGKIIEYLSHSKWWSESVVFVTEGGPAIGRDHVDSHRTVMIGIGPWMKKGYCSHVNASYPALLKTVFRLLKIPPMNLFDASATDLADMFATQVDTAGTAVIQTDPRLFDSVVYSK